MLSQGIGCRATNKCIGIIECTDDEAALGVHPRATLPERFHEMYTNKSIVVTGQAIERVIIESAQPLEHPESVGTLRGGRIFGNHHLLDRLLSRLADPMHQLVCRVGPRTAA